MSGWSGLVLLPCAAESVWGQSRSARSHSARSHRPDQARAYCDITVQSTATGTAGWVGLRDDAHVAGDMRGAHSGTSAVVPALRPPARRRMLSAMPTDDTSSRDGATATAPEAAAAGRDYGATLWAPDAATITRARISRYARWLAAERNTDPGPGYE